MSDLFEDARPVRDATLADLERVLATDPDTPAFIKEGYRLGVHLAALMMTATAQKLNGASGEIQNNGLHDYAAIAISQLVSYVSTGFRPMRNGKPISPVENLCGFMELLAYHALKQVEMSQAGAQDFIIPFRLNNGVMERVEFDYADLMKRGPKP